MESGSSHSNAMENNRELKRDQIPAGVANAEPLTRCRTGLLGRIHKRALLSNHGPILSLALPRASPMVPATAAGCMIFAHRTSPERHPWLFSQGLKYRK